MNVKVFISALVISIAIFKIPFIRRVFLFIYVTYVFTAYHVPGTILSFVFIYFRVFFRFYCFTVALGSQLF